MRLDRCVVDGLALLLRRLLPLRAKRSVPGLLRLRDRPAGRSRRRGHRLARRQECRQRQRGPERGHGPGAERQRLPGGAAPHEDREELPGVGHSGVHAWVQLDLLPELRPDGGHVPEPLQLDHRRLQREDHLVCDLRFELALGGVHTHRRHPARVRARLRDRRSVHARRPVLHVLRRLGIGLDLDHLDYVLREPHSVGDRTQQGRCRLLGQQPDDFAGPDRPGHRQRRVDFDLVFRRILFAVAGSGRLHTAGLLRDLRRGLRHLRFVCLLGVWRQVQRHPWRLHRQVADRLCLEGQQLPDRGRRRQVLPLRAAPLHARLALRRLLLRFLVEQRLQCRHGPDHDRHGCEHLVLHQEQ
mmetsp:Transcript_28434/g.91515  ORF Transcript_28434/g.91515 Transcript_28434/m.91515 type:complete len:356 (-) Transcript_28434:888-1955(-)